MSTFGVSGTADLDGVDVGRDHAGQLLLDPPTHLREYLAHKKQPPPPQGPPYDPRYSSAAGS